ncbi:MAG: MBL fold metallo-hydrolase [Candidatus Methanospirareceae archaeon]
MDEIKFLGTAGARFVMIKQLRSSAGIFLSLADTRVLIDPGPGTLVRFASSKPKIDPSKLDAIILTHKHLDHSNDVNVMIEAMTEGGFKKRGVLLCPGDAISGDDPVVFKHHRGLLEKVEILKEGHSYDVGNLKISTPKRHVHGVETYGLNIGVEGRENLISFISDTRYFEGLENFYNGEVLVMNVVMYKRREGVDHLCVEDARHIIKTSKPKVAILTHFGMTMLRNKPFEIAKRLTEETGVEVIAASDGMRFDLRGF